MQSHATFKWDFYTSQLIVTCWWNLCEWRVLPDMLTLSRTAGVSTDFHWSIHFVITETLSADYRDNFSQSLTFWIHDMWSLLTMIQLCPELLPVPIDVEDVVVVDDGAALLHLWMMDRIRPNLGHVHALPANNFFRHFLLDIKVKNNICIWFTFNTHRACIRESCRI